MNFSEDGKLHAILPSRNRTVYTDGKRRLACLSSGWRKSSASRPRAAAGEARAEAAASTSTRLRRGRLEVDEEEEGFAAQQQRKATGWEGSVGPEMRPGAQAGEAAMPMNREQGKARTARSHRPRRMRKTAGGDVRADKSRINRAQLVTSANLLFRNATSSTRKKKSSLVASVLIFFERSAC